MKKRIYLDKSCPFCRGKINQASMICEKCGTGFNDKPQNLIFEHIDIQNPEGVFIPHGKGNQSNADINHPYLNTSQSPIWNADGTKVGDYSGSILEPLLKSIAEMMKNKDTQ